jgi:hypothetical protein
MPARLVLTLGPTHFVSSIHPLLQVHNTTLLTPNVCHGVMISDDVFLTHRACVAGAYVRVWFIRSRVRRVSSMMLLMMQMLPRSRFAIQRA